MSLLGTAALEMELSVAFGGVRPVLRNLTLQVREKEILGLVGSSGCGKSTLALATLGLLDTKGAQVAGFVNLKGRNLLCLKERELRRIRGREIALVLQSPMSSLNPMLRIGRQLKEAWRAHQKSDGTARIAETLAHVELPATREFLRKYPSQISVGQAQRILIAMAIVHRPLVLIADEPTSALDPLTQGAVLDLFQRINKELGTAILLISHDLTAVETVCDRIAVLCEGQILECHPAATIRTQASHPFTKGFLQSRALAANAGT